GDRDGGAAGDPHGGEQGDLGFPDAAAAVLFRAGGNRLDPDRDAVVRLRLRGDHLRDLQRGVLRGHLQHAARGLDHPDAAAPCRRLAGGGALADADAGAAAWRAAQYRDGDSHRHGLCMARADRGGDDRDQCRARLHAVPRTGLLPDRGDRVRDDRDRGDLAGARPRAAGAAGARDGRAPGAGAADMTAFQTLWGYYARWTMRWPALAALVPFVPLIVSWAIVVEMGIFPRVFLPGPGDVIETAWDLLRKGILTDYLADSLGRLAVGAAAGMAIAIPL